MKHLTRKELEELDTKRMFGFTYTLSNLFVPQFGRRFFAWSISLLILFGVLAPYYPVLRTMELFVLLFSAAALAFPRSFIVSLELRAGLISTARQLKQKMLESYEFSWGEGDDKGTD